MLAPYRVLDLTDSRAEIAAMILADLGADVLKVEPPGGSASRRGEALDPDGPDGMASLRFHVYNRNKRSVTCDIETADGRGAFLELVRSADFLIENAQPGAFAERGLGWEQMKDVNPRLVYVAITPFGQDGPYAKHATSDLTLAAMGGQMAVNGDADRAPLRITVPQTWLHASAEAALAALVAHFRRLQTNNGQFVDVSVQASVFWTSMNAMIAAAIQGKDIERAGTLVQLGIVDLTICYAAADGDVVLVATGATIGRMISRMVDEGAAPPSWLAEEEWPTYDQRFLAGRPVSVTLAAAEDAIRRFVAMHTKSELFHWGLREGITIVPVATAGDVLGLEHLEARGYWQPYTLPSGKHVKIPGPFVRLAKTPIRIRRPAPGPGEHTEEVLTEGREPPPSDAVTATGGERLPFAGLKVADFSWIAAGPITAKYFADHGATVVRVEAVNPADRLRNLSPLRPATGTSPNRSQFFGFCNTSKKGIVLDLKQPPAQDIARKLLSWCDVAFESFTPGTMRDLGLGYETARELNPAVIMVSTCLMGQTGSASHLAGYGYHAAALSGFYEVTGWPDRSPAGPFAAYTDVVAPHFLGATVMAALDHKRRTGQGQYIEQSQMESALHFLAPELLDFQVNGRAPRRAGNDSSCFAPHNAYPCQGEDQWIAIAVETDEQWRAFRAALGNPAWAMDPRFDTTEGRLAIRDVIDGRIGEFTRDQDRYVVMELLQHSGVPAGVVQRSCDLQKDPQLAHRRFFRPLEHPEMGPVPYEGHMFRISGYDSGPRFPAPCLGQDTIEVLTDLLGLSDDELGAALTSGAVGI